jgi:putative transposase
VPYVQCKRPKADKELAVRDEAAYEKDDTMDHRKLAALLRTGKNRIRRVMHTYGIAAQSLRKKYVYPGKATEIVPNKLREEAIEWVGNEVVFSDILEVKRADGTRVRGCFALRHRTRQVLLIAFDEHMRADLFTDATPTMAFEVPGSIWHSEEAQTIWGGPDPLLALAKGRMSLSMSRASTPTDIGMRNARSSSSSWLELHVAPIIRWGDFLRSAETWINLYQQERPARGARYPLSASLCQASCVGGYSFTRPLVMSLLAVTGHF